MARPTTFSVARSAAAAENRVAPSVVDDFGADKNRARVVERSVVDDPVVVNRAKGAHYVVDDPADVAIVAVAVCCWPFLAMQSGVVERRKIQTDFRR